ncbi:MAG: acyltransferase [Nanoarchaeota archaeon]
MFIHKTAEVSEKATIGEGTKIWNHSQIREGAKIGENCIISKNVYIDRNVEIGNNVKIQNNVSIYFKAIIEDGVFIGPHVCFTNDKIPRAINHDGTLKGLEDWNPEKTHIKQGSSIGANSTLLSGITIGKWVMIGAGSVVTKDVPDYGLVVGCPARLVGYVCKCGLKLEGKTCEKCNTKLP